MAETDHTVAIDAYFKRSSEALSRAAADPSIARRSTGSRP